MDEKQIKQFHQDMCDLSSRYGIEGLVAMWFDGNTDNYGFIKAYPIGNTPLQVCVEGISEKLQTWVGDFHDRRPIGTIQVVSRGDSTTTNSSTNSSTNE